MYNNSDARERVLRLLKQHGSATVADLARETGVVPVTMRTHLAALERQGLVHAQDDRGRVGRPRRRFFLTDDGQARFPNRYAALSAELLVALRALAGQHGLDQALDVAAARCVAGHAGAVTGQSLEERVASVANLLDIESGMATWRNDGERYLIQDHSCPYAQLARDRQDICRYHTQVVSRLLGRPVSLERSLARGDRQCDFAISGRPVGVRTLSDGRVAPTRG